MQVGGGKVVLPGGGRGGGPRVVCRDHRSMSLSPVFKGELVIGQLNWGQRRISQASVACVWYGDLQWGPLRAPFVWVLCSWELLLVPIVTLLRYSADQSLS